MDRARKKELVEELNGVFSEASLVVVTSQSGLTVAESTDLRSRMREADASYKVTKNRLVKLAIVGTPYEGISDLFEGPTAIGYSTRTRQIRHGFLCSIIKLSRNMKPVIGINT